MMSSIQMFLPRLLAHPIPFLTAWIIGGILAIVIPAIRYKKEKDRYYQYYGQWNEYNQNGNNNNNNNNNYYNVKTCKWWQWNCKDYSYYYNQNRDNNNDRNQMQFPNWFSRFGGMTEEERRFRQDEMGQDMSSNRSLNFVYTWTLIMFLGLLAYGVYSLWWRKQFVSGGLIVATMVFCQFTFMTMLLLVQGVIQTDDREMEDSVYGWWGQSAVLLFLTDWAYTIFCLCFSIIMGVMFCVEKYKEGKFSLTSSERPEEERNEAYYNNATDEWEASGARVA